MNAWRRAELFQCLLFVRQAREALRTGDLAKAFRWYGLASRALFVQRGMACRSGNPCATGTLNRVLLDLGDDIEAALRPAPRVPAHELVPDLFESLKVLQRRGVDVDDEALMDRARNQAMTVAGHYKFEALRRA